MHRNTYLLVLFLAIVAALVVGVNVGKNFSRQQEAVLPPSPTPAATPAPQQSSFTSPACGISLTLPTGTVSDSVATDSARFVSPDGSIVLFGCAEDIPKIALPPEKIESVTIASSISAKLYHSSSPKDGVATDILIFKNPKTAMDILFSGYGATFSAIMNSLTILP